MELYGHTTSYFKDIFINYESFSNWYKSIPLSSGSTDIPSEKTFTLIFYNYSDSHVCMSDESFKQRFAVDLYTYYKEFEETTKAIDSLMSLKSEDISTEYSHIVNTAIIPQTPFNTSVEEVDFLTQQEKQMYKKGKLQITKELLSNKRTYTVKTFLNRFKHLFIKILDDNYNHLVGEPEDINHGTIS